jgi:cytidylate kinase
LSYFVELEASSEERIERNKHPHRLYHKPSKRNLESSEKSLKEYDEKRRLNSENGEIKMTNYLRIDNTNLSAEKTAQKIKKEFQLEYGD